jgi:hypothetical protein
MSTFADNLRGFIQDVFYVLCMAWALEFTGAGYDPGTDQPMPEVLPHAPRACRITRKQPFRSAVRCTAPPTRWARSAGLQVT